MADDDAAERRRQHHGRLQIGDALGDRAAERFGVRRMLQDERALQVAGAVQAGGQAEVSVEQRAGFPEEIEQGRSSRDREVLRMQRFAVVYNSRSLNRIPPPVVY